MGVFESLLHPNIPPPPPPAYVLEHYYMYVSRQRSWIHSHVN